MTTTTNLEPRKLALAMLNEMHETMGTELVYRTRFEKLAVDKIAEKHIAAALEAQAKQIADYAKIIEAIRNNPLADNGTLGAFLRGLAEHITGESFPSVESLKAKQIEALQADAERYRVGREAAFAGLLVDFPHTKKWSDAMDFAYDQMIAARKGNV